jgi:hypothetical protein
MHNWVGAGQIWLQKKADEIFCTWLQTKRGQEWKGTSRERRKRKRTLLSGVDPQSPYAWGFSLPDWHHDAIKALGNNEEETFKLIKLGNL